MSEIVLKPIKLNYPISPGFSFRNLARLISKKVNSGDILVVSSKLISYCENRLVNLSEIKPSKKAKYFGEKYKMDERVAELVIREADKILGGFNGFLLTLKFGLLCPNAGIDTSNVPEGYAILYPRNPQDSAKKLADEIRKIVGGKVGIVISDSRILPLRKGVVGVALSAYGFEAVVDKRGKTDIFNKKLKFTFINLADILSSASLLLMGEADELIPAVVVSGLKIRFTNDFCELGVDLKDCLYNEVFKYF